MEVFRKTDVVRILWCLVVAGGYAFSLSFVLEGWSRDSQAIGYFDWFSLIFYGLSFVLIFSALVAIFDAAWLWGVIAAVLIKAVILLPLHLVADINIWQVFFRTALVGGLSYMFIHWSRNMQAYRQANALPEEF